jgi:hypothetical protein
MTPGLAASDIDVIHVTLEKNPRTVIGEDHAPDHVSVMIHLYLVVFQRPHRLGDEMGHLALFTGQAPSADHFPAEFYQFVLSLLVFHPNILLRPRNAPFTKTWRPFPEYHAML